MQPLPLFLYSVTFFIMTFCFFDTYSKVKLVVKLIRYCGAVRDGDPYNMTELLNSEYYISYKFNNSKGGAAIKSAKARRHEDNKVKL